MRMPKKAYEQFLRAQELESRERTSPYYTRRAELVSGICSIWDFMREVSVNPGFSDKWYVHPSFFDGLRDNSELQQESLLRLLSSMVLDDNIDEIKATGKGQIWYLFANATASISSYNRFYWVSKKASSVLKDHGIDGTVPVSRSKIFQIRKGGKKMLVFEHMCPATQLIQLMMQKRDEIRRDHGQYSQLSFSKSMERMIKSLIHDYGVVAIVTKKEDDQLRGKLRSHLDLSNDGALSQMLKRYESAGVELEQKLIPVYGKMYR